MTQLEAISIIISGIVALLTFIGLLLRPLFKKLKLSLSTWESFMRDWNGEEQAPGRDPAAGVMQRLNKIDGEFKRNGGSTMKDDVAGMKESISDIKEGLGRIEESLVNLNKTDVSIETRLTALENPGHKRAAPKATSK